MAHTYYDGGEDYEVGSAANYALADDAPDVAAARAEADVVDAIAAVHAARAAYELALADLAAAGRVLVAARVELELEGRW
jgi:hypothetical protein